MNLLNSDELQDVLALLNTAMIQVSNAERVVMIKTKLIQMRDTAAEEERKSLGENPPD